MSHARRFPQDHRFRYRTYQWLVDVTDLPEHRPLASFRVSDHLGDPDRSLRENVATFTAAHGVPLAADDRVLMLANARNLGYVFDPLTVFWCFTATGELRCVVFEVHNTYGERHAQLAKPDDHGRFSLAKEFYVSPFFTVDGRYDVTLRLEPDRVAVVVELTQDDRRVFSATFAGRPRPARGGAVVKAALRVPFVTYQVWALIRMHGVWLWFRRLPVIQRRRHVPPEGVR
ncbi:DUF1365 domain-containing protein [Kribbella amoyensis]|uniref:DUF1365 domain-containing protein n=1 Tax=Kribbella amoyensis TaxID=996641 RepID=UPI001EE2073C|nr:DUF1365 domain-containing protein [Kribbella amoyensis]